MGTELASYLVTHRQITADQANDLLQHMVLEGGSFDTQLLENDLIDEASCLAAMQATFNQPVVTKKEIDDTPPEVAITFPLLFAQMHNLVPHRFQNGSLVVLATTPPRKEEMENLIRRLGVKVVVRLTIEARIHYALNKMYGLEIPARYNNLLAKLDGQKVNPRSLARMKAVWSLVHKPIPEQNIAVGVERRIDAATLRKEMIKAGDRDLVINRLLEATLTNFNFVALFTVVRDTINGWACRGGNGNESVEDISIDLAVPSMLQTVIQTESPYLGRVPKTEFNRSILESMGRTWPAAAFLAPLRVSGKVVAVLYGDTSIRKLSNESVKDLLVIIAAASHGLENVIRHNKLQLQKELAASAKNASANAVTVQISTKDRAAKAAAITEEVQQNVASPSAAVQGATDAIKQLLALSNDLAAAKPAAEEAPAAATIHEAPTAPAAIPEKPVTSNSALEEAMSAAAAAVSDDDDDDDDDGWDSVDAGSITSLPGAEEDDTNTLDNIAAVANNNEALDTAISTADNCRGPELILRWQAVIGAIRDKSALIPKSDTATDNNSDSVMDQAAINQQLTAAIRELLSAMVSGQLDAVTFQQLESRLLAMPDELLMPELTAVFPGTLTVDPFLPGVRLPVPEELSAILALLMHLNERAAPVIEAGLEVAEPRYRFVAAYILSRIYLPSMVDRLGTLLYDPEPKVRFAAAYAMRRYSQTPEYNEVLSFVRQQMDQADIQQQMAAIQLITQLRDHQSVPQLIDVLLSGSTALITTTTAALLTITGQAFGNNVQAWQVWWETHKNSPREYWLFEGMMHQDPTVRQVANAELMAITGFNAGFNAHDTTANRTAALQRWQAYFENRR